MKKTHWFRTTLITLAACALVGLLLAVILFNINPERTGVTSSIEFSFEGAANGLAPNGLRFDLSGLSSDEVLNAALEDSGFTGKYTADQLRNNIIVSGVYPDDIIEQMTGYESVLTGNAGKVAAVDYHSTLYNIALYNDFDKSISRTDLEKLLSAIMTEFRIYFEKTYSVFLAKDTLLENLSNYDYPQQVDLLMASVERFRTFANQMASQHSEFRLNSEGFSDIAVRYDSILSVDLEHINGQITMNGVSMDTERLIAKYQNRIRILKIRIREMEQESKDTEKIILDYDKDNLIYVLTSENLQQVGTNSTETYDTLVSRLHSIENTIAEQNREISQLNLKVSDLSGKDVTSLPAETANSDETGNSDETDSTAIQAFAVTQDVSDESFETKKVQVEEAIDAAVKKLDAITKDFSSFLQAYSAQEMNDRTIVLTKVKYVTPNLLSASFVMKAVRTAGPLCALGFIVCLVCLIMSRIREEKKKA